MSKRRTNTSFIDPDDAPDLSAPEMREKFARAPLREGSKIVRRGRPPSASPKQLVSLRLDREVLTHFKIDGPGWQTRINEVLRREVKHGSGRTLVRKDVNLLSEDLAEPRQAAKRAPAKQRA